MLGTKNNLDYSIYGPENPIFGYLGTFGKTPGKCVAHGT